MIAIDTSLLLQAHREEAPEHSAAQSAIETAATRGHGWGIPLPCVIDFYQQITDQALSNASPPEIASDFIEHLVESAHGIVWQPGPDFGLRVLKAAADLKIQGQALHNLQIELIAFEGGAKELWTTKSDFPPFPGLTITNPLDQAEESFSDITEYEPTTEHKPFTFY